MIFMLLKATRAQIRSMLRQRGAILTFCLLLTLAMTTYIDNILEFRSLDVLSMYHPMKILTLSYNRAIFNGSIMTLNVMLFPLLVCVPAGLSLAKEQQTGEDVLLAARLGNRVYLWSKLLAVITVTWIVFSLPFLIELLLNCIAFPLQASGDLWNQNVYGTERATRFQYIFFRDFSLHFPYLYAVVGTLLFGLAAGLLAGFTTALSALVRVKYRVFLILPVFLLLYGTDLLSLTLENRYGCAAFRWHYYLFFFQDEPKSTLIPILITIGLLAFTLLGILWGSRKDRLK